MRTPAVDVAFIGALVYHHPHLTPILQEHLDDQEGELLPHLAMADIERWIEDQWSGNQQDQVLGLLAWMEAAYAAGDDVTELIAVSFIEHLPYSGPGSDLRDALGPTMREYSDRLIAGSG